MILRAVIREAESAEFKVALERAGAPKRRLRPYGLTMAVTRALIIENLRWEIESPRGAVRDVRKNHPPPPSNLSHPNEPLPLS
jgi:hypothetical protein